MRFSLPAWAQRLTESGYQKVHDGEEKITHGRRGVLARIRNSSSRVKIYAGMAIALIFVLALNMSSGGPHLPNSNPKEVDAKYLHILIPANKRDINLCKTVASAAVLKYPIPTLVNWKKNFSDPVFGNVGDSHIGKIKGVLDYLNTLPADRDDDLVVLVDGYDIWFQLRPETLLERYFDINQRADERVQKRLGKTAAKTEGIRQSIVFSAQKKCWPRDSDDPACFAAPESSLPKDSYGPLTDTKVDNDENEYIKFRPRYLNSGVMMGELGSVKKFFNRSVEVMALGQHKGSDQNVFSQIFGEQEYQREVIRERYLSASKRFSRWLKSAFGMKEASVLDPHPTHKLMAPAAGAPFEFGIGLDYASVLGHPTVFAEYDSEWVQYNDPASIEQASKKLGISSQHVHGLPDDIACSLPPFWSQNPDSDGLPQDQDWSNVTLHTNLWTASVPAMIHHNAHINGMKNLRQKSWDKVWFQPYLRPLLNAYVNEPYRAFAVLRDGNKETAWWSRYQKKWETHSDKADHEWVSWKSLCGGGEFEKELFRDGLGSWEPPRFDY
ncbi:hypothetical protein BKA61DRAFT_732070 [Leptodontidium sp. MPI-SDFR-AT-0119]|nr:hypothetical protein BKA61DRAFT_732070 [Leptodontidium sp. MPI-SDFR-AT-0119]